MELVAGGTSESCAETAAEDPRHGQSSRETAAKRRTEDVEK